MNTRNALLLFVLSSACVGEGPSSSDTGLDTGEQGAAGASLTVVGFNVESGDAVDTVVARTIADVQGESAWGFSEVYAETWMATFQAAAADDDTQDFQYVYGKTGGSDRLALLYDANRLELLDSLELRDIAEGARAPLVGRFRDLATGQELMLMVNHLWRTDDGARRVQSQLLNAWAQEQTVPVLAVGDYNYDWEVEGGDSDHDIGYDELTKDGVYQWVRPEVLVATQCSWSYNSVLDFVFTTGAAQQWPASSEVLFPEDRYCIDTDETSDHRPVAATFQVPPAE